MMKAPNPPPPEGVEKPPPPPAPPPKRFLCEDIHLVTIIIDALRRKRIKK